MPPLNDRDSASPSGGCGSSESPAPLSGRRWWRSIEEKTPSPELLEQLGREFPEGASELPDGEDRRTFIKLMGASMALAGIGLSGCRRWPEEKILPYAVRPADRIPGTPVIYATATEYGGVGMGLLATSFDGRPIKLDGNAETWMGGGTSTLAQASIIALYNPERSIEAHERGAPSTDANFSVWAVERFAALKARGGEGLAFLSEAFSGPTFADMKARVMKAFPKALWATWEPLSNDAALEGTALAFGSPRRVIPDFSRADVIVSLDDDFLNASPISPRLTRDFAQGRRPNGADPKHATLSRLYAFESTLSVTGMNADERFAVQRSIIPAIAAHIAGSLEVPSNPAIEACRRLGANFSPDQLGHGRTEAYAKLLDDLRAARGRGVVVAGPGQPAVVHAICALINDALGNSGATVRYVPALESPSLPQIKALVDALQAGRVETLVMLGGNPVYTAPADLDFGSAMTKAREVIHLSLEVNETSQHSACTWHLPAAHYLECWGDVRNWDHSISIQQPLILPLVPDDQKARSPIEMLAMIAGDGPTEGEQLVRRTHTSGPPGLAAEVAWRRMLERGSVPGSAATAEGRPAVNAAAIASGLDAHGTTMPRAAAGGLEVVFFNDMKVFDGRFGSIGWLQELPDPVTKITWDNAALLSPKTAAKLGVSKGEIVRLAAGGRSIDAAVWPLPGHADDSISIALGYGRRECGSSIARDAGFNAYALRTSSAPWVHADASVTKAGGRYAFAHTQDHGVSEAIIPAVPHQGIQARLPSLVRQGTLSEYRDHPDFAAHRTHVMHRLSLWEETNLDGAKYRWAMSVDLSTCTGCSACVVACQAENNIPIVGKDQVARGRELHWIRIDRYFRGDDIDRPDGFAICPVTCMQCENAPCEQVCPVAATVHDDEGLNNMVYNRCIGTRYCSNNCPYKVRRFNFFDYQRRTPIREQKGMLAVEPEYFIETGPHIRLRMQFNPEVTVRMRGVMEKCTFCVQRIQSAKIRAKNAWTRKGGTASGESTWTIPDGTITTACQDACPAGAIVFGDLNDPKSRVSALHGDPRSYQMLEELNTKTRLRYMARVTNPAVGGDGGHGHASNGRATNGTGGQGGAA
ncbi:MAG: TAT-variant-translocated molybdopterin oxidoreductase [Phycisphaeraceae bacterium]|nr:TAT-variant-translocated molybdopterin oxidoreductase [Phycisphaeraceae bacterium]